MRTPERGGQRSLSHGDDTPRPAGALQGASPTTTIDTGSPPNNLSTLPDHPPKRLGFLGEKLLSSGSSIAPQLLPTRSHSRAESALPFISRDVTASPTPGMIPSTSTQQSKGHTSPSKVSLCFIGSHMHRLGTLAHLPSLNPTLSSSSSTNTASPSNTQTSVNISTSDNPWATLHIYVLPLFNGEPLRVPIEDLNGLVKRHIQTAVSSAPSRALANLEHDTSELIASGMVTLNAKLAGIDDDKILNRVVDLWMFFWDQVLPYVEGALLPLQTDPLLSSLYRMPKAHKSSSSPVHQNAKASVSSIALQSTPQIDVRTIALQLFRDKIIFPAFHVLNSRLSEQMESGESPSYQPSRLQHMLLVLVSQRPLPSVLSLTEPTPPPTPGEEAILRLLRTIRTPSSRLASHYKRYSTRGAPSFLSAGLPRDRRGRIAMKPEKRRHELHEEDEDGEGIETPRIGGSFAVDPVREREREFLESLRSPDPENTERMSMGGWGLGVGKEEKKADDEEEEDNMDWDQAQAVVERMVGMKSEGPPTPEIRRRMT
ncbi:HbrB-like-domain-containing protein [Abortiporus biennis]|nr:HbrB-like-domain-containing protein [Abortiporus biennis]